MAEEHEYGYSLAAGNDGDFVRSFDSLTSVFRLFCDFAQFSQC